MDMLYETCRLIEREREREREIVYTCVCENDRFYRDVNVIVIHCCIFRYFEIEWHMCTICVHVYNILYFFVILLVIFSCTFLDINRYL